MLGVVEDDQRARVAEMPHGDFGGRAPALVGDAYRPQQRFRHGTPIAQPVERDEPDAAREVRQQRAGRLDREAGLAHAARPREGDEALASQVARQGVEVVVAPDQRTDRGRQIVRRRRRRHAGRDRHGAVGAGAPVGTHAIAGGGHLDYQPVAAAFAAVVFAQLLAQSPSLFANNRIEARVEIRSALPEIEAESVTLQAVRVAGESPLGDVPKHATQDGRITERRARFDAVDLRRQRDRVDLVQFTNNSSRHCRPFTVKSRQVTRTGPLVDTLVGLTLGVNRRADWSRT